MAKANQRDAGKESFWREVVAAFEKSGQTARAFCRQRHVSEPGFYWWRRELRRRNRTAPAFAAVTLRTDESRLGSDEIEIRLPSGSRIRFRGGCPTDLLGKALALLERQPSC